MIILGNRIHKDVIDRYDDMLKTKTNEIKPTPGYELSPSHLRWMLVNIKYEADLFKAQRWLGFVQAGVVILGLTTVEKERDFTRPYFSDNSK
jgi:hypothetical protein